VPHLSAHAVVIHYEEALYQVYAPFTFTMQRSGVRSECRVQARVHSDQHGRRGIRGRTQLGRRVTDPRAATTRRHGHTHGRRTTTDRKFRRRDAHARNSLRLVHLSARQQRPGHLHSTTVSPRAGSDLERIDRLPFPDWMS